MTVEERIERLERELAAAKRRNRWLMAAAVLAVVGLAWAGNRITGIAQAQEADTGPKVVRANQFILEDEKGRMRATLAVSKDTSALRLYDKSGKPRAVLGVLGDAGPALVLNDGNDKTRVQLIVLRDVPVLALMDGNDKSRIKLGVLKDGEPVLALHDETGKVTWSAP